jgi:hypothetical protein
MSHFPTKEIVPSSASAQAHTFLLQVEDMLKIEKSSSPEHQKKIGELLRNADLSEAIKLQATNVLSDLILNNPVVADPEAVRRMAKFVIHGTTKAEFSNFDPSTVMTNAVNALTGYVSNRPGIYDEELGMFLRVTQRAKDYRVPKKNINALSNALLK